ncbi:MAG: hypothetical protein KDK78_03685 [Chlamydiia bacterium]|nr:hypothetical protein [Chlamydiia bacterium]
MNDLVSSLATVIDNTVPPAVACAATATLVEDPIGPTGSALFGANMYLAHIPVAAVSRKVFGADKDNASLAQRAAHLTATYAGSIGAAAALNSLLGYKMGFGEAVAFTAKWHGGVFAVCATMVFLGLTLQALEEQRSEGKKSALA